MNEIAFDTMDGKPIRFVGGLETQNERQVEFADGEIRKFALKLYRIKSGGFVPTIEFTSSLPTEKSGCIAEMVDQFKDIENFLFVFVPDNVLPKIDGLNRDESAARKKLSSQLRSTYESLTFEFLDGLSERFKTESGPQTATT
jgi:hypothetical protein